MPEKDGALTAEEKKKIADTLTAKRVGEDPCPFCSTKTWAIADHVVAPVSLGQQGSFHLGGFTYPNVLVICTNCGYTRFFNAVLLGLLPPAGAPKPEEKKPEPGLLESAKPNG